MTNKQKILIVDDDENIAELQALLNIYIKLTKLLINFRDEFSLLLDNRLL